MGQSRRAQEAGGGYASGHHSYPKGHGGGNKVGATTHAPKEWGSKARKEEEHLTGLARQAELDAIAEGLAEAWEAERERQYDPDADYYMEDLSDKLLDTVEDPIPGVTLNGQPLAEDYDEAYWDDVRYYDSQAERCPCCGQRI